MICWDGTEADSTCDLFPLSIFNDAKLDSAGASFGN